MESISGRGIQKQNLAKHTALSTETWQIFVKGMQKVHTWDQINMTKTPVEV